MAAELAEHNFQLVICDESHSIKDPKARRPARLMTEMSRRPIGKGRPVYCDQLQALSSHSCVSARNCNCCTYDRVSGKLARQSKPS